jgi:triphosphoribosyl-dephospho-CoA synthetase
MRIERHGRIRLNIVTLRRATSHTAIALPAITRVTREIYIYGKITTRPTDIPACCFYTRRIRRNTDRRQRRAFYRTFKAARLGLARRDLSNPEK